MDKPFSVTVFEGDAPKSEMPNVASSLEEAWRIAMSLLNRQSADLRDHTISVDGNGHVFSLPANMRPPWD